MNLQTIIAKMLRAIENYDMILDGDKIAIDLTGQSDSIVLLHSMYYLKKFYEKKFDFIAVTIYTNINNTKTDELEKICNSLEIKYVPCNLDIDIHTSYSVYNETKKRTLNSLAVEHGCNKVAIASTMDDVVETFMYNLISNSKLNTIAPITHNSKGNIETIRPFIYVSESQIHTIAKKNNYLALDEFSTTQDIKKDDIIQHISEINRKIPNAKENIFGAIKRSPIKGWKKEC